MAPMPQAARISAPVFIASSMITASSVIAPGRDFAEAAFGGEVEQLSAGHAADAGSAREFRHQRDAHAGIGMGLRRATADRRQR